MMTAIIKDPYAESKALLAKRSAQYQASLNGKQDHPLHQLQAQATEAMLKGRFPSRREESYKYTSLRKVLQHPYQFATLPATDSYILPDKKINNAWYLTFINGHWVGADMELNDLPPGINILPISEALEEGTSGELIQKELEQILAQQPFALAATNIAFARQGFYIHIEADVQLDRPLYLRYLSVPGAAPMMYHPQLVVIAEQGCRLRIVEEHQSLKEEGAPVWCNTLQRVIVAEQADLTLCRIQHLRQRDYMHTTVISEQERDSTFTHYTIDLGGEIVRNNLSAELLNSHTQTNLYGIYLPGGRQHIDNQTYIDHAVPHCQSNELYKGVVGDRATAVFNGQVMVRQDAQKTNAFQQNATLLLTEQATMNSKPQLEIFADDVRCSHGATIGQLDEEAIFYLQARGLSIESARSMLKMAFLREVIDTITTEQLHAYLSELVQKKLHQLGTRKI